MTTKTKREIVDEAKGAVTITADGEVLPSSTPTEREERMRSGFQRWEAARAVEAEIKKKGKEKVAGAMSAMRTSIEAGTTDDTSRLIKLAICESQWQALDEAKAEAIEDRKHAQDVTANAYRRMKEAVENSAQMALFETE